MNTNQLRQVEEALGLKLPASYQEVVSSPPFDPAVLGRIYWLFDDPDTIIAETKAPMAGLYEGANWRAAFVAIGESASGDLYLLDTAQNPSPIYCLSHEDHSFVQEFPDIGAYIAYWHEETKNSAQQAEAAERDRVRTQREATIALAVIGLSILFIVIMLVFALLRHKG